MSFDPRLLAYVESLICILAFDSIFIVILFDCCNPWSSLISLNHGSFDVIIGMDWLSKRKFVIVCHEKVVRIPLEGDEILQVHGKRTQGVMKTLLNTKVDEPKVSDTSVVRDFVDMFQKTCR
ncbi:putative reverse transcriptase domain-containing protein [Tanacetum coccineum]|uniref:Reverse transcriptase domain-containing protein n=1 Tax=Tanacetum coccineum TaxID=301880 RepID=A0ABQ5HZ83_9ASTR